MGELPVRDREMGFEELVQVLGRRLVDVEHEELLPG